MAIKGVKTTIGHGSDEKAHKTPSVTHERDQEMNTRHKRRPGVSGKIF